MQHLPELIGIASALTIGAVSPGPRFVMVARTAASVGRLAEIGENSVAPISLRFLLLGLTTQLSNPKTAIVSASVFAGFLPADASIVFKMVIACLVFLIEAGRYTLVALVLSSPGLEICIYAGRHGLIGLPVVSWSPSVSS